ncbi:MAG: DUF92 domain-containing protein [Ignavibacteria bacterium]|jgi:uncharacterized protein (TIGR00297 family)|nr:DUF92 domain-containing protein [Ignavibacteria bacterium]MCU7503960.1 DUF92 domain-containing protein [Ignavibacteria bacterium]MCU7515819.1 DUF92 domain-containing protein [Ignavibacteria bacterium]
MILPGIKAYFALIQFNALNFGLLKNIILAIVLGAIAAVFSFRLKFLTRSGSRAAFLLALPLFALGGWKWSVPMIWFFLSSSILSRVRKKCNSGIDLYFEKSGVRDYFQVFSNGGLGGILVIMAYFSDSGLFYTVYIGMLSAVCADTWATEIGTLARTKTYNVLNLQTVEQGSSGGVSIPGTLGSLSGALTVAISSAVWVNEGLILYFCTIVLAGISGSFIDSLLGATLQSGFYCSICGKLTEKKFHCMRPAVHKKGILWIGNDLVNLTAGITGGIFAIIFRNILR